MKLTFAYDRGRDIWCVLNYGKTSMNSPTPTKVYEELVKEYGDNPSQNNAESFVEAYINKNTINTDEVTRSLQKNWDEISLEYQKRAEKIFGVGLPNDVTAYSTINDRCPYNIQDHMFYVSVAYLNAVNKTAMHELWHFYTWYKYGIEWEQKIGTQKYNEIKEALTVLLNVECEDLLPEGIVDKGYTQHQELRQKILDLWSKDKDMDKLWQALVA